MTVGRALQLACWFGLLGLALIVYSVIVPRPIPVFLAMTLGQVIGTVSFGMFLAAVIHDLRRSRVLGRRHEAVTSLDEKIPER